MNLSRVSLIFIPFMTMLFAGLMVTSGALNTSSTVYFNYGNVTVNEQTGNISVSPIFLADVTAVLLVISVALAVVVVMAMKVFGSGISGSVLPIVFIVTVLSSVFVLLSGLSFPVFTSIPYVGIPIYFGLIVMYIIGVSSLASGSGGD